MFTKKTLNTLEYNKIKEMLAACALTAGAKERAHLLEPISDMDDIVKKQLMTSDAKKLASVKGMPSFGHIVDISEICDRAEKGATLSARELLDVADILRGVDMLLEYIRTNKLFDTVLDEIFERLIPDKRLKDRISRAIISEEMIADDASPELSDIRRKKRITNNKIKDTLQKYTAANSAYSKALQENIVTMRDGRYVVPVKVEYKSEIKGLVHDTSASGATLFVEPMSVVEANNELRILESREQHEIDRILAELSADVATIQGSLILNYSNITELAFVFACAELSFRMNAISPQMTDKREVILVRARHPMIDKASVVPINVSLGVDFDTLIITGPNTGGKTVTLKTLGLFALMAQSGLHIPAEEPSSLCVFDDIAVDIGDEQSIEHSLSTFSSHMVNIVAQIERTTDRSLVLFDELGAGTDPIEGAALALSIIETLRARGALIAATTHYAELKAYALETAGVTNASCEFNVETLRPTYKLVIGTPGKSNAFAISSKLGLSDDIIDLAKSHIKDEDKRFENVIEKLEISRMEMEREREEAKRLREEYEHFKRESEAKIRKQIDDTERETTKAKEKAIAMVESAKISSEYVMAELDKVRRARESERLGEELDAARKNIREHLRKNEDKYNPVEDRRDENYVLPRELRVGDEVLLMNLGKKGVVSALPDKDGNVLVTAGIIKTRTPLSNLKLLDDGGVSFTDREKRTQRINRYHKTVRDDFRPELDIRGMNGEDGWMMCDKYLDEALIAGIHSVRIVHGKGTGALKKALWGFFKKDPRIASFRMGQYGEGDAGVTVIELK